MTTIAHTISASYIAYVAFAGTTVPLNTNLLLASILPAALLDLDHLYYALKFPKEFKTWQTSGQLHKARSFLHEILGVTVILTCAIIASFFFDQILVQAAFLSYTIHVIEDMIMGISVPLKGINSSEMHLFHFTFKQKAAVDLVTILIFGGLWIQLLAKLIG